MKNFFKFFSVFAVVSLFVACSDDENSSPRPDTSGEILYVLNSGDWKSNNSSLTMYNVSTGESVQGYFELVNGRGLGNTANDIIVYGDKMYIAVAGESSIEVADTDAKSLKRIECGAQPRYLAAYDGKVYATYYNGFVARLDTLTLEVDALLKVGRNPEQLAICGDKLYVANSGGMDYNSELGYDNTVSVVDIENFREIEKIDVVLNPSQVVSDGKGVYVASYGNYADVPGTLQYIPSGGVASVVGKCSNMTEVCYASGLLYGYFSQYDADWNATITYLSYNPVTGEVDSPWIKESYLPSPYKVCSLGENVCVTSSDYINNGDVYVYDNDGMLVFKISAGLNPVKVVSLD